ncbi:MAG: CHAT domain-containing protein [Bryobacterales bacterium]|nr:CHAT domain-containing protein [Bryobacterales bacterium]
MRCLAMLLLLVPLLPVSAQRTAAEWLRRADSLFRGGNVAAAQRAIEQTIDLAMQQHDEPIEAQARLTLGARLSQQAQYEASDVQMHAALALYERSGNRRKAAESHTFLGQNAYMSGRYEEARGEYERAMAIFETLEDWEAVARMHYSLTFFGAATEQLNHLQRGLELARKAGSRRAEAELLHAQGDWAYGADDFDAAFESLSQARSILEALGDQRALARTLTSIGRLYRVHGHPDQALLCYRQARDLQREAGDAQGGIQSLVAMGVALNLLGRSSEALRYDQEAVQLARKSGSPLLIKYTLEAVASSNMHLGQYAAAASVLEEARHMPPPRIETLMLLSSARFHLGQYEAARDAAEEGLRSAREHGELRRSLLENRAQALWKLGKSEEAARDVRELMKAVEEARAKLVSTDFMKQGFSDTDRAATGLSIQILLDTGDAREALEVAERARGRALLDLLAAKNVAYRRTAATAPSESAPALARRLNSTILAYWVDERGTVIWTVSPEGRISHARTATGAQTLERWVLEAMAGSGNGSKIATRSGSAILAGSPARAPWRQLYDAVIRPIRSSLPLKAGSRLTIIPSGPLFRVSFAALLDERNRYLIEKYALHYAPAIDVFEYTDKARQRAAGLPARYLLVANPAGMPSADGKPLPALPGSEQEAERIAALLPAGSGVLLKGKQADEASVRTAMPAAKVIHLATHGIIDNHDPLGSFLALGRTVGRPGGNGRLTAAEVYKLDLRADLVVLSACSTGLGRISGDGVAGLARAFFYAGVASVLSTVWDVADLTAARLIEDFYRSEGRSGKSEALRNAQLRLIRALRRGEVRVDTPFGALPLPEEPALWAGYVLLGEPD